MTIGQKIIQHERLTTVEADQVYQDLSNLNTKGFWDLPDWAGEVSSHYKVDVASTAVQMEGWKAVSRSYKLFISFLRKSI